MGGFAGRLGGLGVGGEEILCHSDTLLHGHLGPDPPFPFLLFVGRPNMQITCLFRYRPMSLFSTGAGMAAEATCSYCAAGTYYTGTGAPTAATCGLCGVGTFSTGTGMAAAETCSNCSAGTYSTVSGAIVAGNCSQCAAGTYFTGTGAPTAATCALCSAGTFSTGSGEENGHPARIRNSEGMAVPRASVSRSSRVKGDAKGLVTPSGVTFFLPCFRPSALLRDSLLAWT